jgi:hypothetical protein
VRTSFARGGSAVPPRAITGRSRHPGLLVEKELQFSRFDPVKHCCVLHRAPPGRGDKTDRECDMHSSVCAAYLLFISSSTDDTLATARASATVQLETGRK